jgi:hypothetical protein
MASVLPGRARLREAHLRMQVTYVTWGCSTNTVPPSSLLKVPLWAPAAGTAIARTPAAIAADLPMLRCAKAEEKILGITGMASLLSPAYGVS